MGAILAAWIVVPGALQPDPVEAALPWPDPSTRADHAALSRFGVAEQDSTELRREARNAQARFERARVHHAPAAWGTGSGACTEIVGRICLRFDPEDDPPDPWEIDPVPPEEASEVGQARAELLEVLDRVSAEIPGDAWVAGQRVRYRAEAADVRGALDAARDCRSPEPGWCLALQGLAELGAGNRSEAEERFREMLSALPDDQREAWLDPSKIVDVEIGNWLGQLDGAERRQLVDRIWRRSDPWLSTQQNELLLAHLARHVSARLREGTRTPFGHRWGDDMAELLVRYGPESWYERIREPALRLGPTEVIGHHRPGLRHQMPSPAGVLPGPDDGPARSRRGILVAPEAFTTEGTVGRSLHGPGAAPRIRDLSVQMARFPRGPGSAAWVVAWRAPRPGPSHRYWSAFRADSVAPPYPGDVEQGLWFQPWEPQVGDGPVDLLPGERVRALKARPVDVLRSTASEDSPEGSARFSPDGVMLSLGPDGDHLVSFEVVEAAFDRGWRHRRGVSALAGGAADLVLSDLLLLRTGSAPPASDPGTLRDWLPRVQSGLRVPRGPVEIAWELHAQGQSPEAIEVVLEVVQAEGGFFRRLGRTLRLLDRPSRAQIAWTEAWVADEGDPARMSQVLRIDLSDRDHGEHEVVLRVSDRRGQTASTRLVIEVVDGS